MVEFRVWKFSHCIMVTTGHFFQVKRCKQLYVVRHVLKRTAQEILQFFWYKTYVGFIKQAVLTQSGLYNVLQCKKAKIRSKVYHHSWKLFVIELSFTFSHLIQERHIWKAKGTWCVKILKVHVLRNSDVIVSWLEFEKHSVTPERPNYDRMVHKSLRIYKLERLWVFSQQSKKK